MISVIIPVYKELRNLTALIPRIEQIRKGHNIEVIISKGSCTEDYSEIITGKEYVHMVSKNRKGRAKQMNDGVQAAKGDIFVFLHADVIPPDSFFSDIKTTIQSYDAGFFSYTFDTKHPLLKINAFFTKKDGVFTGGGDQCLFIKRNAFEQLSGFNENQVLMEDFEFFKRMKKNNLSYKIVPNNLVVSARKYKKNSYLRVNLTNLLLVCLFRSGFSAEKLKRIHDRLLHLPYQVD